MKSVLIDRPPLPRADGDDAGGENWTMIFVLDTELDDQRRSAVLGRIDLKAAFVRQVGERLALSVGVNGPMDNAMAFAASSVQEALQEAAGESVGIVEARMVGHCDVTRQIIDRMPITFYGVTECAKALGVSRQRVRQLMHEQKLPQPDAQLGGKPVWEASSFDHFASERSELVSRTPLGLDPREFKEDIASEKG